MILCLKVSNAFTSRLSSGRAHFCKASTVCRPAFSQRRQLVTLTLTRTKGEQRNLTSQCKWRSLELQLGLGRTAAINRISMKPDDTTTAETREVHPEIEPFDSGFLPVSDLHQVYYEQSGNADGKPVLFL